MRVNKNKQQETANDAKANRELVTSSVNRSTYKAPGTRFGTLLDWRAASPKTGEIAGRYGRALRDGQ